MSVMEKRGVILVAVILSGCGGKGGGASPTSPSASTVAPIPSTAAATLTTQSGYAATYTCPNMDAGGAANPSQEIPAQFAVAGNELIALSASGATLWSHRQDGNSLRPPSGRWNEGRDAIVAAGVQERDHVSHDDSPARPSTRDPGVRRDDDLDRSVGNVRSHHSSGNCAYWRRHQGSAGSEHEDGISGFLILDMRPGLLTGYIQTLCIRADQRGAGIGSALLANAEQRIFRDSPNAFICVSSFNERARRLYERLGYSVVGTLSDYVVAGHDELLLRKTRGSWAQFRASQP